MEVTKTELFIDKNYIPSLDQDCQSFFTRAMVFAQTNYSEELNRIHKTNFIKLSPIAFFEEYCWHVCVQGVKNEVVSNYIYYLLDMISPLHHLFLDMNFNETIDISSEIYNIIQDSNKVDAILKTANIMHDGIKLFDWDIYKDNFLATPENLTALPHINLEVAKKLSSYIGNSKHFGGLRLRKLSDNWGFENPLMMCQKIQKSVNMKLQVIEIIFWYASFTFIEKNDL